MESWAGPGNKSTCSYHSTTVGVSAVYVLQDMGYYSTMVEMSAVYVLQDTSYYSTMVEMSAAYVLQDILHIKFTIRKVYVL